MHIRLKMVPDKQTNKYILVKKIQMKKRKLQENFRGTSICSIMGPLRTYKD